MGRKGCNPGVTSPALLVHGSSGGSAHEKKTMKTLGLDWSDIWPKDPSRMNFMKMWKKSMLPILCFLQATTPKMVEKWSRAPWILRVPGAFGFRRPPSGAPATQSPHSGCEAKRWSADVGDHAPHLAGSGEMALALLWQGRGALPTGWGRMPANLIYILLTEMPRGIDLWPQEYDMRAHFVSSVHFVSSEVALKSCLCVALPQPLPPQGASMMKWLRQQHPISMGSMPRWPLVWITVPWPLTHWSAAHRKPEVLNTPKTVCESTVMVKFLLYL